MSDKITHVKSMDDHNTLIAKNNIVIIDFHASWCGPCHMIAPVYERLANETPGVTFAKVDVDAVPEVAQLYKITAMPTFKLIISQKAACALVDDLKGADPGKLEALVQQAKGLVGA